MNLKSILAAALAFLSPLLASKGIIIPPEFAGWISALFLFFSGLAADGLHLGAKDLKTTLTGVIGGLAILFGTFGFDIPVDVQMALTGAITTVIGIFSKRAEQGDAFIAQLQEK